MNAIDSQTTQVSRQSIRKVSISLILVAFMVSLWFMPGSRSDADESPSMTPIPVSAVRISEDLPIAYQSYAGTTQASQRITVRSQVGGRLLEQSLRLGQTVAEGDLLATLYNPEALPVAQSARQRWEQSKINLRQRQRDLKRITDLYVSDTASKQELENAQTAHLAAQAAEASAQSDYRRASQVNAEQQVRAPFAGMVTAIWVEEGEVIRAGQPLLQLADPSRVEVEVPVSATVLASLQTGHQIPVTLGLNGAESQIEGVVAEITPFRERGALPSVVVELPYDKARPGVTAQVHFPVNDNSRFALPVSAVVKAGTGGAAVYRVVDDHSVELVPVHTHQLIDDQVTITAELDPEDKIVTAGAQRLFAGARINLLTSGRE